MASFHTPGCIAFRVIGGNRFLFMGVPLSALNSFNNDYIKHNSALGAVRTNH